MNDLRELKERVHEYYREYGRHDLPWRIDTTPYSIFISEVMLQQTQVSRVRTKYAEFTAELSSFEQLAAAPQAEVIRLWQGLGYNRRALWLKAAAELVVGEYGGKLPDDPVELRKLPGIGPNTAGSIAAFAFDAPVVFIETNIRRVFIHHCFADRGGVADIELLPLIEQALDGEQPREWYWALMDYGSYLATQLPNPNRRSKHYAKQSKFVGSDRQIRGEVLRILLGGAVTHQDLLSQLEHLEADTVRVQKILDALDSEGFIESTKDHYGLR
jgi:A/G-specific adenine glycosylase